MHASRIASVLLSLRRSLIFSLYTYLFLSSKESKMQQNQEKYIVRDQRSKKVVACATIIIIHNE